MKVIENIITGIVVIVMGAMLLAATGVTIWLIVKFNVPGLIVSFFKFLCHSAVALLKYTNTHYGWPAIGLTLLTLAFWCWFRNSGGLLKVILFIGMLASAYFAIPFVFTFLEGGIELAFLIFVGIPFVILFFVIAFFMILTHM